MKLSYRVEILNADGNITFSNVYKSLHDMSKDANVAVPYHQLREVYKNRNDSKYKNTQMARVKKYIRIFDVIN
jgi:hypothetical protein